MADRKKILAIVGSYRKGSVVDSAVSEVLAAAAEEGAETAKIYLTDHEIKFCQNCRSCTQQGDVPHGQCVLDDDMEDILRQIEEAGALVLGSPVNFGDATAITKRFLERLVCLTYWPWDKLAPSLRNRKRTKQAVIVTSSAAPSIMGRLLMHSVATLKNMARVLGAKPIGSVYVGMVKGQQPKLPKRALKKAQQLGRRLAAS